MRRSTAAPDRRSFTGPPRPSRDAVFCGAGLIVRLGEHVSANAYYNADFGRSNLVYHLVSAGLEVSF